MHDFRLDRIAWIDLQMSEIQLIVESLERRKEEAWRERAVVKLGAERSEAQRADLETIATEERRTAAGTTVRQQGQVAQAGTFTTVNHTRSAPTPKFDEEVTREDKGEKKADGEREEQADELGGEQTSRSDEDSSAEDGRRQETLQLPPLIEKISTIELACWANPGAQQQVAPRARHVETHPTATKIIQSYAKEAVDEEMVACSGKGFSGEGA